MFKRIYWTLLSLWSNPRYWRNILACKYAEPLHYHHDACPACYVNDRFPSEDEMDAMSKEYLEAYECHDRGRNTHFND